MITEIGIPYFLKASEACVAEAQRRQVPVVISDSAEQNTAVKNLMLRHGFVLVDACKYAANNFYSAVYAKWLGDRLHSQWNCSLRYRMKKAFIHCKYRKILAVNKM